MTLTLTMIKTPAGVPVDAKERVFDAAGGALGRGNGNDWVLHDPERFLSSKHCQIEQDGEQFYLLDLSTNGTFLNAGTDPVGRGNKVMLKSGDQIDVGDYRFKVLVNSNKAAWSSPFDQTDLAQTATTTEAELLEQNNFASAEALFMSSDYAGAVSDIAPEELKITDPLLALDQAADPFAAPVAKHNSVGAFGSQEDSANLLQEAAAWPELKQEAPVIPDDWDQDISILAKRKPQVSPPHKLSNDDSLIAKNPSQNPEEFNKPRPVRPTPAPRPSVAPTKKAASTAKPAAVKVTANKTTVTRDNKATSADALMTGLGLEDHNLDKGQLDEIHATVGTMMRETLEGLLQILRSRTSIKNEFRMNVTTIQPVENNPIKFSVNVDEMLETMFVRKSRAYQEPVDAIKESFNSIADHQVAVIAGIRQAFRAALAQFDPLVLEDEFKKAGKTSVVPGMSGGKYWSAYQERYQSMVNNMERSFQELFGDEFVQAYEDQLRKLALARKRNQ